MNFDSEVKVPNIKSEETFEVLKNRNQLITNLITNEEFGISAKTAYLLNNKINEISIKKDLEKKLVKELVSQKGSNFKYTVKRGDTIEKISKKFGIKVKDLIVLNNIKEGYLIKEGEKILIPSSVNIVGKTPTGVIKKYLKPVFVTALDEIDGLLTPVSGLNQKLLHSYNGVDISAECGSPVYSADSGIVIESKDGWNGGYGNYIKIQHINFESLYGHLNQRYVEVGDYIEKGSLIGTVGATGKTTGCHLHFEARGRSNPFSK